MNVADVGRALLRHPIWLVLGIVLAVVAGGATFSVVAPEQQSTASVVILPPAYGDQVASQNPFLNLDNTLAQLATIVGSALTSGSGQQALEDAGATAAFTVANTTSDNPSFAQLSPELVFTVTDPVAARAQFTAEELVRQAGAQLDALQDRAAVPDNARARAVTVAKPSSATLAGDGQIRAGGGVGLIVLVLVAAAIVLLDAVTARRRRRRQLAADVRRPRIERPSVTADTRAKRDVGGSGSGGKASSDDGGGTSVSGRGSGGETGSGTTGSSKGSGGRGSGGSNGSGGGTSGTVGGTSGGKAGS